MKKRLRLSFCRGTLSSTKRIQGPRTLPYNRKCPFFAISTVGTTARHLGSPRVHVSALARTTVVRTTGGPRQPLPKQRRYFIPVPPPPSPPPLSPHRSGPAESSARKLMARRQSAWARCRRRFSDRFTARAFLRPAATSRV